MTRSFTAPNFPTLFSGIDVEIPVLDGSLRRYINLDNAASTPPFKEVLYAINRFLPYYSSVHRGTGFKSQISTHAFEAARQAVLQFVAGDPQTHTCIFVKNATEGLNKLARRFPFTPHKDIVLTSGMEHHSNDLPWRAVAKVIHIRLQPDGYLDEADFDRQLNKYADRIALVAITGASNVTGYLNPIHRLAEKAHAANAQIAVDCAQLAPHRKIDMRPFSDPCHIDYVAISAHKLYAPFGMGALVGPRTTFERGDPDSSGGGTVEIVTRDNVVWANPPGKEEAGSPNTVGAVALTAAIHQLTEISLDVIAKHEAELTTYALKRLTQVPGLHIFGDSDPDRAGERLGVIPFQMDCLSHFKVAAILGYEFGIGVRSGCFCAHPYILHLLGLTQEEVHRVRERMIAGDKSIMPGLVRISFGLYNTTDEIDTLVDVLSKIVHGQYQGTYIQDKSSGEYSPIGWSPDFNQYLS